MDSSRRPSGPRSAAALRQRFIAGQTVIHDPALLRQTVRAWRRDHPDGKVALVPTMGALHAGHLSLVREARRHADAVIVSVFVNPAQFAPHEDFAAYPRTLERDCDLTAAADVAWVFAPSPAQMYPQGFQTSVQVQALAGGLCGVSRPHFFGGVALVVLKLLNLAEADVAVFGEKDWQQLQVIRRMARDLDHPTVIVGAPLVRDHDGLALSSRNAYLDAPTRARALAIPRALGATAAAVAGGERDAAVLQASVIQALEAAGGRVDYVAIVDPTELSPLDRVDSSARLAVAAWFGTTRLIDNIALEPPPG